MDVQKLRENGTATWHIDEAKHWNIVRIICIFFMPDLKAQKMRPSALKN